MSARADRVVLDNAFLSTLQEAQALERILMLWPGRWVIPLEVIDEAEAWRLHGALVIALLRRLQTVGTIEITAFDPRIEGALFTQLSRTLGQGESAVIAIAYHRGYAAALDDRRARRACDNLKPPVPWLPTEGVLSSAVADGLLSRVEAETIWRATGISDPKRSIQ
jgi:predicted nucleic acid-binding protein